MLELVLSQLRHDHVPDDQDRVTARTQNYLSDDDDSRRLAEHAQDIHYIPLKVRAIPVIIIACERTKISFLPLESARGVRKSKPMIDPM